MSIDRKQVCGFEISEGVSKKSGTAYSIGTLHTLTKLAPPMGTDNIATGHMGDQYRVDAEVLRRIAHLPTPFMADVVTEDLMRFGKRETIVTDVRPVEAVKKTA
ncbi:hypothetical protein FMZ60_07850 [Alcaligenaceae bacterium SJ-26]|nr:hypothetical protein FMZ60_07850 [Alcaligenaceae bacterium SJ-26]